MIKPFHIVCAVLLFVSLATFASAAETSAPVASPNAIDIPAWFKDSFLVIREDIAEATAKNKRLVVYFGQDGCPYCKELMRVNFSQKDIMDYFRANFDAIALNMWGDRDVTWLDGKHRSEKELAAYLKVQFTPTLLFFDEKGNVALRLNGYYAPHKFKTALEYVAKKMESTAKFSDYMKTAAPEPASGKFHDESFFMAAPFNFKQNRTASKKPLAILFEQKDCAPCDELHARAFKDPEVLAMLKKFDVARLNIFGDKPVVSPKGKVLTEAGWASELKAAYTPSMVFFDTKGKEVFRIDAYLKTFHVVSSLDYVASKSYLTQPSFQRYIEARASALQKKGVTIDIWK